jgi:hypothetical protein
MASSSTNCLTSLSKLHAIQKIAFANLSWRRLNRKTAIYNKARIPVRGYMCFSAEASLSIGALLIPMGGYCIVQAIKRDPSYLPLSAMPLAFGIQQICEGIVWNGIEQGNTQLVARGSLGFLAFALTFWPFWVPFSMSVSENRITQKRILWLLAIFGASFGLYLYIPLLLNPDWLTTKISGRSIQYDISILPTFKMIPSLVWHLAYIAGVTIPFALTLNRQLRIYGTLIGISALISHILFWRAFFSVWCFFAAGISAYLIYVFHNLPPRR